MKKTAIFLFFIILFLACASNASGDIPAAMIVKFSGDVKVTRGGMEVAVKCQVTLKWDDRVSVAEGGSAQVLFQNGNKVTVTKSLEITPANAEYKTKVTPASKKLAEALFATASKNADFMAKGGIGAAVKEFEPGAALEQLTSPVNLPVNLVEESTLNITSPLNSKIIETTPIFAWSGSGQEESAVKVFGSDDKKIWGAVTKSASIKFGEGASGATGTAAAPLRRGSQYTLVVTASPDDNTLAAASWFYVLNDSEAKDAADSVAAINAQYPDADDAAIRHILTAEFYKDQGLYADAETELKQLVELDSGSLYAHRTLADIYSKTGDKEGAQNEKNIAQNIQSMYGEDIY